MPSPTPPEDHDANGSFPHASKVALVLIDWINDLEFEGGEVLLEYAVPVADRVAALKRRAKDAGVPVIYANDNFGQWRSDFRSVVDHVLQDGVRGRPLAERLAPDEDDYFVLKPKNSAFYHSTLETLLHHLGADTLILTGVAGDICVFFTANDAYLRDFRLLVPSDCSASQNPDENDHALAYMRRVLDADTRPSTQIDFAALHARSEAG